MTYFGLTACSAVYYQVPHCRFLIVFHDSDQRFCRSLLKTWKLSRRTWTFLSELRNHSFRFKGNTLEISGYFGITPFWTFVKIPRVCDMWSYITCHNARGSNVLEVMFIIQDVPKTNFL
jgi:hypothetical protein